MKKIKQSFVVNQYESGVDNYKLSTESVGLWESERFVFTKYLHHQDVILDVGCGTGRTTFALYDMGYKNIRGVDLTPGMIRAALELKEKWGKPISFEVGDVTHLQFADQLFDVVIFSFNGLMSIPSYSQRNLALNEVRRVLKPGGLFIFTTHDRERDKTYLSFWEEEQAKWKNNLQDTRLHEFGDVITTSKNEKKPIFIHIPTEAEIRKWMIEARFTVLESFFRKDLFQERDEVINVSGECRFWVTEKDSI